MRVVSRPELPASAKRRLQFLPQVGILREWLVRRRGLVSMTIACQLELLPPRRRANKKPETIRLSG